MSASEKARLALENDLRKTLFSAERTIHDLRAIRKRFHSLHVSDADREAYRAYTKRFRAYAAQAKAQVAPHYTHASMDELARHENGSPGLPFGHMLHLAIARLKYEAWEARVFWDLVIAHHKRLNEVERTQYERACETRQWLMKVMADVKTNWQEHRRHMKRHGQLPKRNLVEVKDENEFVEKLCWLEQEAVASPDDVYDVEPGRWFQANADRMSEDEMLRLFGDDPEPNEPNEPKHV